MESSNRAVCISLKEHFGTNFKHEQTMRKAGKHFRFQALFSSLDMYTLEL